MNMKMKMKNNKTMLALVLVAALALCSVGVVAAADDSSAEAAYLKGDVTVTSSMSGTDIFVYSEGKTDSTITIPADVTYSGTISYGYYNAVAGVAAAYTSITVTSASNVIIAVNGTTGAMSVSGTYDGSIALVMGSLTIADSDGYSGTVTAGNATFAFDNITDAIITYDGKEAKLGEILDAKVAPEGLKAGSYGSVTVSGTAFVDDLTINANAEMIVAEGATVETSVNTDTTYTATVKTDLKTLETNNVAITGSTTAVVKFPTNPNGTFTVSGLTVGECKVTVTMDTYVYVGDIVVDGTGKYYVVPSFVVSTTSGAAIIDEEDGSYTIKIITNCADLKAGDVKITDNESGAVSGITVNKGVITVPGISYGTFGVEITMGTYVYVGTLVIKKSTDVDSTFTLKATQNVTSINGSAATAKVTQGAVTVTNSGLITVNGTMNVTSVYTQVGTAQVGTAQVGTAQVGTPGSGVEGDEEYVAPSDDYKAAYYIENVIDNSGEITVNGLLTQMFKNGNTGSIIDEDINAVEYFVSAGTNAKDPAYNTYYYTTITNALAASDDVIVLGEQTIDADMTLISTVEGSESTTIALGDDDHDATLIIGTAQTTDAAAKEAIVTVPKATTLSTTDGKVEVVAGQFKIEDEFTDRGVDQIVSAVFMTDNTYGIYTDLVTALDAAVSGDVVTIRAIAEDIVLSKSTEVKADVELDGSAFTEDIIVCSGITFTVTGTMNVNSIIVCDYNADDVKKTYQNNSGILNFNSIDVSVSTLTIDAGIVNFTSAFDNTDETSFVIDRITIVGTEDNMAIVNVEGKYTINTPMTGAGIMQVNVNGTLTSANGFTAEHSVDAIMNVTGTVDASACIFGVVELYATGSAKIIGDETGYLYVSDIAIIGTESKSLKQSTNSVEAFIGLDSKAVATVYGQADKVVIENQTETVATAFYVDSSVLYETIYYGGDTPIANATSGEKMTLPRLAITGFKFVAWYSEPAFVTAPVTSAYYGQYENLYASLKVQTFNMTFSHVQNGQWTINGQSVDGITDVPYNANGYDVQFNANSGYELKNVEIMVNGHAMPTNYVPADGDVFTITGEVVEKSSNGGMDLVTILLIIITIVIIIMAIIIALKLLRS